ncbi:MAG TPA: acetyl-CoA carboxylase biotin carboxylase subunit [Dehalococcoidia bacterium]|nr:acetyl-CoA carboxylase biotin carboxylase subunit [Dehalococcoidia bacterium]
MFRRVLIANRGEIACRIARTCHRLGVESIAVYSAADADALHVRAADRAEPIGPAALAESYLSIPAILAAAERSGAEAVHPGYGLLSERADFARAAEAAGLVFIGPSPAAIEAMASKTAARARVAAAGVPLAPGSDGALAVEVDAEALAAAIGYPVMVKASEGGGGIGMTIVHEPARLRAAVERARRSAARSFGSDAVYLERFVERARHVEVQIFGDAAGNLVALGDRDCSVQRRHQKVTEEALAPGLSAEQRAGLHGAALRAAVSVGYTNAGTVEFLLAPDGAFYFLEMNTRLQVEHPVTELITGLDLVEWQLRVAAGEPLPLHQEQIRFDGHAIECRIYAEDPHTHLPSPGTITRWQPPAGEHVRIDSGVATGSVVSPFYDPLLAKLAGWGATRHEALARMQRALAEFAIDGLKTNLPLLRRILDHALFVEGRYSTELIATLTAESAGDGSAVRS